MKTHISIFIFLIGKFAMSFAQDTILPDPPPPIVNPCGVYDKQNIGNRRQIPYTFLRESDVAWQKRIWRDIDLREKQNQPLYYPDEPSTEETY